MITTRDGDEIVVRMKVGSEAGGFARFLSAAADALEAGHIAPTNPYPTSTPARAARQVRAFADTIMNRNV